MHEVAALLGNQMVRLGRDGSPLARRLWRGRLRSSKRPRLFSKCFSKGRYAATGAAFGTAVVGVNCDRMTPQRIEQGLLLRRQSDEMDK